MGGRMGGRMEGRMGRKNGGKSGGEEWEEEWETGFLPEVRFQGGALVRAADKGEPVG